MRASAGATNASPSLPRTAMAHLVRDLLGWASEHGIQLHPSLRVRLLSDSDSPIKGVSVFSEQAIERNEIGQSGQPSVFRCLIAYSRLDTQDRNPLGQILCSGERHSSCTIWSGSTTRPLGRSLPRTVSVCTAACSSTPRTQLTVRRARREESKWHGYLQSLPSGTVPIALLWGDHDAFGFDPDGEAARQWIVGTEVERTLCGEEGMNPLVSFLRDQRCLRLSLSC